MSEEISRYVTTIYTPISLSSTRNIYLKSIYQTCILRLVADALSDYQQLYILTDPEINAGNKYAVYFHAVQSRILQRLYDRQDQLAWLFDDAARPEQTQLLEYLEDAVLLPVFTGFSCVDYILNSPNNQRYTSDSNDVFMTSHGLENRPRPFNRRPLVDTSQLPSWSLRVHAGILGVSAEFSAIDEAEKMLIQFEMTAAQRVLDSLRAVSDCDEVEKIGEMREYVAIQFLQDLVYTFCVFTAYRNQRIRHPNQHKLSFVYSLHE